MGLQRRSLFSAFLLPVYLATVFGAGLHHHGETSWPPRGSAETGQAISRSLAPASGDDRDDECAVCTAIHQARPLPAVFTFQATNQPLGQVLPVPLVTFFPPLGTAPHARGPPAV